MTAASVIVPAYQRVSQTIKTIELLFASSGLGKNFEIEIIVADSSPDQSLQTALEKSFGQRARHTRPAKPGIAANKNQGARLAAHPILIFCDSDMEVEVETLWRTIDFLGNHATAAAVGGTVLWQGGPMDGKPDRPRPEDRMHIAGDTVYVEALYSRYIATYKDIFWKVGGYDETVFNMRGEGSDLSCRYWRAGYPLTYEKNIVVHHVYDAPDSAAIRIPHPEWGIGRDLLFLAYKYGMLGKEFSNFVATVGANFPEDVQAMNAFIKADRPHYPFGFLEVFTDETLLGRCLAGAEALLLASKGLAF